MTMRTRAIMAVALIVAVGVFAAMSPSAQGGLSPSGSSSSGGCLPPTLGADLWAEGFPGSQGGLETLDRDCDILCRSHVRKCKRIVRLSRTCNSGTVGTIAQLIEDVCRTFPTRADRRSCARGAEDFKTNFRSCVRQDARRARGCCENNLQACVTSCTGMGSPIQLCFTGGSCLFDAFNQSMAW